MKRVPKHVSKHTNPDDLIDESAQTRAEEEQADSRKFKVQS